MPLGSNSLKHDVTDPSQSHGEALLGHIELSETIPDAQTYFTVQRSAQKHVYFADPLSKHFILEEYTTSHKLSPVRARACDSMASSSARGADQRNRGINE